VNGKPVVLSSLVYQLTSPSSTFNHLIIEYPLH